jgi:hypothetical protein
MADGFEVENSDFGGGSGHYAIVFFQRGGCSKRLASGNGRPRSRTDRSRPRSVRQTRLCLPIGCHLPDLSRNRPFEVTLHFSGKDVNQAVGLRS